MDQHTLIISCVEYYSCAKELPAPLAFRSFEETDLMPLLLDSQKQFPQMQLDFFLGIIDGVLTLGSLAGIFRRMSSGLQKSARSFRC